MQNQQQSKEIILFVANFSISHYGGKWHKPLCDDKQCKDKHSIVGDSVKVNSKTIAAVWKCGIIMLFQKPSGSRFDTKLGLLGI